MPREAGSKSPHRGDNKEKGPFPDLSGPDRALLIMRGENAHLWKGGDGGYAVRQLHGIGNGQLSAATSAAAGKNLATILGGHAGTEAVHLRALTLLGLISSDRGSHSLHSPYIKVVLSKLGDAPQVGTLFHA